MTKNGDLNFVLIGAKSTGKTVYLAKLSEMPQITIKDKQTLNYLKPLREKLANDQTPAATSLGYQQLLMNYHDDDYTVEFQIDDYDGKFVEQYSADDDSENKEQLVNSIERAEGIIMLLPLATGETAKFKKVAEEIDLFITAVKEKYSDQKKLPTPVIIGVSKWDESVYFQAAHEERKALEYINGNDTLRHIKEKIHNYFSNVDIVPFSSYEKHNLLEPIRFFLAKTFVRWEEKIETLKDRDKELVVYLHQRLYDLQHHKDGVFVKLYNDAESRVFAELEQGAKACTRYDRFLDFRDTVEREVQKAFNNKNASLFGSLKPLNIESLNKISDNLLFRKKLKQRSVKAFAASVVVLAGWLYYVNVVSRSEERLYADAQEAYKNKNFVACFKAIGEYKAAYSDENQEHYKAIVTFENSLKKACRADIDAKTASLQSKKRLNGADKALSDIEYLMGVCAISNDGIIKKIREDVHRYESLKTEIYALTLAHLKQDKVNTLQQSIGTLEGYAETTNLKAMLDHKLIDLLKTASDSTEDTDKLEYYAQIAGTTGVSGNVVQEIRSRKSDLQYQEGFQSLKKSIKTMKFDSAISYIKESWKPAYAKEASQICVMLDEKVSGDVREKLMDLPEIISKSVDKERLRKGIDKIDYYIEQGKLKSPNYEPTVDAETKVLFDQKRDLLKKYSNLSVIPKEIHFIAYSKENSIGFECDEGDEIVLTVGTAEYSYKEKKDCQERTMSWGNSYRFFTRSYSVVVKELDTLGYDDNYGSSIELSEDDILNLKNHVEVTKNLGHKYSLIFKP